MQEKNSNQRNISKKRSENVKYPPRIHEKIKYMNNLIASPKYNNNSINNSLLLNKSVEKFDQKQNPRNISQSTKYMKTKEKVKITQINKSKNRYGKTKEKDIEYNSKLNNNKKDEKFAKSKKKYINTKDILLTKGNSNLSFNQLKKNYDINNPTTSKINKIPRFHRIDKKIIVLPFLYRFKKSEFKSNVKTKKIISKRNDYNIVLQYLNLIPNIELAIKLLLLPERSWMEELKENSMMLEKLYNIEKNKSIENESNNDINSNNNFFNNFIKDRLMIQEDFNWLVWGVGIWYWTSMKKIDTNLEDIKKLNVALNKNDISKWKEGIIYNGVYFLLLDKVKDYNRIKIIKREIKTLNLLFLDYIQLLDNITPNKFNNNSKQLLSNNILFPLISLIELTDYYIFASVVLEPSLDKRSIKPYSLRDDIFINQNNYYNDIDLSNYYLDNLKQSPLFFNLAENNILNLNNGKFLLINVSKNLHPLMIPENENQESINTNIYKNNIYLKYPIITHIIGKQEQIFNKSFLNYFEYFINYLQNNKYIIDIPNLEYEMNKFGINKCFYLFILSKIKLNNSCDFDTNNNICSLIKIYILVKLLTKIDDIQFSKKNNKENNNNIHSYNNNIFIRSELNRENYSTSSHKINMKSNSRKNIKYTSENKLEFNTQKVCTKPHPSNVNIYNQSKNININKRGIKFISHLVLTILNPKSSLFSSIDININDLVYKLLEQSNIYLENFKNLNSKIFSFDVKDFYEPRSFLKSLIKSARSNPFIFLKQIETKFNVVFNYEIKYRTSICIENFMKYFNGEEHITEKEPRINYSYINADEIGSYLLIKSIYNDIIKNNKTNNIKKKDKIMKNVASENIDYIFGRRNYDNFSILNRSIINNRNSNFRILNSSIEKPIKKQFNNVPLYTECNNNHKVIYKNDNERNNKNQADSLLSGSNLTSTNNNIGSESTKNNEDYSSNYYKTNDKSKGKNEDNNKLDMYEFEDEESEKSEKSFNINNEDSNPPSNYNKKRNTTNVNSSKFNLNNVNKKNGNSGSNKTLNTLNYNTNTTNKVFNGKNLVNKMTPSSSLRILKNNNHNNSKFYWYHLFNNYHLKFPSNLHKIYLKELKSNIPIYRYLSMYYSFSPYSINYNYESKIELNDTVQKNSNISQLFNKQKQILETVFSDIISPNPNSSYILINFYIYYFLNFYIIEKDGKICEDILNKINSIILEKILYKKINYEIVINLLNGMLLGADNFLKVEEYFTKSLILSLIEYGEPRGRNNDGRSIMMFPIWKTGRNFSIMDNNEIINENFKEMFKTLLYYNENKTRNKNNNLNSLINDTKVRKENIIIDKNIMNDLYRETKYDIKNYKKSKKFNLNLVTNLYSNNIKVNGIYTNTNNNINKINNKPFLPTENKNKCESYKKKKNNSGFIQNYFKDQNDDTFLNLDEEDLLERPSKCIAYDELNLNDKITDNNNYLKNKILNDYKSSHMNNKYIFRIDYDATLKTYFFENSFFSEIKFPNMNDKNKENIQHFFSGEMFFIYFIKSIFSIINFSSNELSLTEEYLKDNIFEDNQINSNINNKKQKLKLEKILNENLYYKKYNQSNILVSFGNNSHCETGHIESKSIFGKVEYKPLSTPRLLYQLKNKKIISINSGWEHNICQDSDKMLYSWGNNSRGQCGFDITDNSNKIITYPKNIVELNDKNIKEISCGNEHTLALTNDGDVFSWGSTSDGVLGREIKGGEKEYGIGKPGKITFFIKNDIKIRHITSGSIHNLCLDNKSNLYSWGCSKGGQLGFDENELSVIYNQNSLNNKNSQSKDKLNSEIENDNNFCLGEPKLIKSLKDIEIIKISSGEAHNAALSIDGKCFVWGLGSNGQLGLGFCEDCFPYGESMKKTRVFTPTVLKEFDKKNDGIIKVFCGKTFTIFLNQKDELYSTGINDLNQCGIDNKLVENINLCNDIVTPIKIEMFIKMKIINISCGESHVLAITEDNGIRMLFSWGSNRFGQLGQGITIKKSLPKIVNYFLHYNNSIVSQVSCGAFHSLVLIKMKEEKNYNPELGEKYIFGIIDKYEDYNF